MKKRFLSLMLCCCMALSLLPMSALAAGSTPSKPTSGDGTLGSPYQITSAAELYWFAGLVNGSPEVCTGGVTQKTDACATLTSDITVNAKVLDNGSLVSDTSGLTAWTPIGGNTDSSTYSSGPQYSGVFDGGNHTISGLYFNDEGRQYVGLFGYCSGATIKNVKLADSYVRGFQSVGGICGISSGGTISNCLNSGAAFANGYVGGISGKIYNAAVIEKCGNKASVRTTGDFDCGGGICGENNTATISNCWNAGAVSASKGGGICGVNFEKASITNCYNFGAVGNDQNWCGAVVGANSGTTLSNCYYDTSASSVSKGIGTDYSKIASVTGKTTAEFSSGEVCYLLNNGVSDGTQVWYQNIDNGNTPNTYPQFSGGKVIKSGYDYTNANLTPVRISLKDYAPGKTWDGTVLENPKEDQLTLENTSYANVTFTWYKGSVDGANKQPSAPSAPGTYYVVAFVEATATTSAAVATSAAITISEPETVIELSGSSFSYTGTAIEPTVTVKDSSTKMDVDPSEYTVSYINNTNVGTATVTVSDVADGIYTINATMTFTITKVTPAVTVFPTPESGALKGDTVKLFVALSGGKEPPGTVTIKDGETTIASNLAITGYGVFYDWKNVSGGNHSITAVYTPTAEGAGKNFNGATSPVLSYKIIKPSQSALTITGKPTSVTYGDSFTLGASGGSGDGAMTWAITAGSSYATVNSSTGAVSITGAGNVAITATKAGGDNYEDATATYTFTAVKAEPIVGTVSYNGTDLIYLATALATVNGKLVKSGAAEGILALSNDTTFTVGTKDYTWVFTPSDTTNYKSTTGTISLTVTADTLTGISIGSTTPNKTAYKHGETFDTNGLTVTASYTSGNTVVVTNLVTSGALAVGQTSVELSYTEGSVTKTCTVNGINVGKAIATITGVGVTDRAYTGNAIAPNGTAICKVGDMDVTSVCGTLVYTYSGNGGTSYAASSTAPTNVGSYRLVISIADDNTNYTGESGVINFTITPKQLTITDLTAANRVYDGTTTVVLTGGTLDGKVRSDDVTVTMPVNGTITGAGVGTGKTVTVKKPALSGSSAANYTLDDISNITVDITPAFIAITGNGTIAVTKPYNGTTTAGTLTGTPTFRGKIGSEDVSVTATPGSYAADAVDVGTGKNVTLTLALEGTDAGNYELTSNSYTFTGAAITKGTYGTAISANVSAVVNKTTTGRVTPSVFTLPASFRNATIVSVTETEDSSSILTMSGNGYTIAPTTISQSATCSVILSSSNYENVTATLTFIAINKEEATIMASIAEKTYDGTAVSVTSTSATSGLTYHYQWQRNTGTANTPAWETLSPNAAPKDTGSYRVMITGESDTHIGIKTVTFTITKAIVVATAENKNMTTGSALPTFTVSYTGIVSGDTADSIFSTKASATTSTDGKKAGSYPITVTTPVLKNEAVKNYTVGTSVNGTLTVSTPPSGGGSSGGGSGSGSTTTTTITIPVSSNEGSVKASTTVSGNTATVSMTEAQMKEIASSNANIGALKVDASALKVDTVLVPATVVSAASDVSALSGLEVALPSGTITLDRTALSAVSGKGDVKISVDIVSNSNLTDKQKTVLGNQTSTALVVDVNVYVNGTKTSTFGDGKIQVAVPYTLKSGESPDSITVWFMKDDGSIEPKNGTYANGKVTFTTDHLSKYLIVSFPFMDVAEDSWYYGNVAYAYDSGLFSGTSATTFSPDVVMTRQMIWMVLARMDGKTPANMEEARAWAMEKSISDGSNSTDSISREQMVAILYRYATYKKYDTTQGGMTDREFEDYDSISGYARTPLGWAVNAGLIKGSSNKLMPHGDVTRAQVTAILMRFHQNTEK